MTTRLMLPGRVLAALSITATLVGCGGGTQVTTPVAPTTAPLASVAAAVIDPAGVGSVPAGLSLYGTTCAGCHGGSPGTNVLNVGQAITVATLNAAIAKVPSMANLSARLGAQGKLDVSAYIASVVAPAPVQVAASAPVYITTAAAVSPPGATSVELGMRRLTRDQFVKTLEDLTKRALPTEGVTVAGTIAQLVTTAQFPTDSVVNFDHSQRGGFARDDQRLTQGHIEAIYAVSTQLAATLTSTPSRMSQLLGSCSTSSDATTATNCLTSFVQRFGRWAQRSPVSAADVSAYVSIAGSTPTSAAAVADVIATMLSAPRFVYLVENGAASAPDNKAVKLTAYELAARLSYHFWQTMPDDTLNALADNGTLLTPSVYTAEVARLAADPRADATIREFFAQWFRLQELDPLDSRIGDPVFNSFAAGFVPNSQSRANAINDVVDMVSYQAANGGALRDLLTDTRSYARTPDIASLYGASVWSGSGAPSAVADPTRAGLLTRIAFLATGSSNTRPIMKGLRIRTGLLCQTIPPPPANAMNAVVVLSPTLTTREVVEQLTQQPNTNCTSCHTTLLNPMGFNTENFDALGRPRTAQPLFDATGAKVGSKTVNTAAAPAILNSSDTRVANNAKDLTKMLTDSGEVEACFAKQYFRFAFARQETSSDDGVLADLRNFARAGWTVRALMATVALRPEFQSKDFR